MLLRDAMGSSAAVSNGFVRLPCNLTRLFSVAVVDFHVLRAGQLDEALATANRVGGEMREDPSSQRVPPAAGGGTSGGSSRPGGGHAMPIVGLPNALPHAR